MSPALTPAYLARLAAPLGQGDLEPADRVGEAGSVVGGGAVRVSLRLAHDPSPPRRIATARVRVLASPAGRAPGSVLAERLPGHDLESASHLGPEDLLAPLGPVPPAVERAAAQLVEALRRALEDGRAAAHVGAPGVLVCRCLSVGDRAIRRAARCGARTVPDLGRDGGAGTGCHACWPDVRAILDEEAHPAPRPEVLGDADLAQAVRAVVTPLWRAQGLRLGTVRVEGEVVHLGVAAADADALASPLGAVALAGHALRECIGPGVRVEPCDP